jgi:catechol 2,3-dioxygenase-like lactoylglutathione lyase family enzyme
VLTALDHAVLAVADLSAATAQYEALFRRTPSWRAAGAGAGQGTAAVLFRLPNFSLELLSPQGEGAVGDRLRQYLKDKGDHLATLAFHAPDIGRAHRRFANLGLEPSEPSLASSVDQTSGRLRRWQSFRAQANTHGVRVFVTDERAETPVLPIAKAKAAEHEIVTGLDHLVVRTSHADRAAALYGARLGLPMLLDRTNEKWDARLMFFACGDLIVEVAQSLSAPAQEHDDLWGLTWRVADADAARARMASAGITVSDVRDGRRPGTRVFTVKSGTCGVPTLCIQPQA